MLICFVNCICLLDGSPQRQEEQPQEQVLQKQLKYLDFVHLAAVWAVVCLSRLYGCAKESSGPLRPGVETVEGTVRAVIGPVFGRFHGLPYQLLKFVDSKVSRDACTTSLSLSQNGPAEKTVGFC